MSREPDIQSSLRLKLEGLSTDEIERQIDSGSLDPNGLRQAKRILRERYAEPDRKLARRLYSVAAWTLAFAVGTFVIAVMTYWLMATNG